VAIVGDACTTPGCNGTVTIFDGEPTHCNLCRAEARVAEREKDRAACCLHLGRPHDEWFALYGTDEGRERWLASQVRSYERVLSGPNEGKPRTPAQARAAAMRHWRSLRDESIRMLRYARKCEVGHACNTTSRVLDTDLGRDSRTGNITVRHHLSVVVCDRQGSCRDYAPRRVAENEGSER